MQNKKQAVKIQDNSKQIANDTKATDPKLLEANAKSENAVLADILKRHGINKTTEDAQRKQQAEKFQREIQDSGLKVAFELVLSELVSKNIPKEDFYVYTKERLIQLGEKFDGFKEKEKNKENKNQPQRAK